MDDQRLVLGATESETGYGLALFDISAFSGQIVKLSLSTPRSGDPFSPGYGGSLDNIAFAVPEPSSVLLFVIGGIVVNVCRARNRICS